jgi:hypothetical protein
MKVRISDQSLRIRISKKEANALREGAIITTAIQLSPIERFEVELLTWNLTIGEVHTATNKLVVSIPFGEAERLITEIGYTYTSQQFVYTRQSWTLEIEIDLQKENNG